MNVSLAVSPVQPVKMNPLLATSAACRTSEESLGTPSENCAPPPNPTAGSNPEVCWATGALQFGCGCGFVPLCRVQSSRNVKPPALVRALTFPSVKVVVAVPEGAVAVTVYVAMNQSGRMN